MKTIFDALEKLGWKALPMDHEDQYTESGGSIRYPTFVKNGVKAAFSLGRTLTTTHGLSACQFNSHDWHDAILSYLGVMQADQRGRGRGSAAMQEILAAADATDTTLFIEPVDIEGIAAAKAAKKTRNMPPKGPRHDDLVRFYSRFGFAPHTLKAVTMERPTQSPREIEEEAEVPNC
jgi:GNAT superfamily N-acetyltransferase